MNGSILLWLLFAVVFFWAYGLNNRLGRMRARSLDALDSLEKHMRQYAGLVQSYVALDQDELPVRWQRLMDALNTLDAELKDVRTTPLTGNGLGRLWRAFEALQAAWTSLVKAPIDVAGVVVSDTLRTDWDATTFKVLSTRGGVNGILSKYNEAVGQVPARWLARLLGYVPVGQIE